MVIKALDAESVKKLEDKRMAQALNIADIEGLEMQVKLSFFSGSL